MRYSDFIKEKYKKGNKINDYLTVKGNYLYFYDIKLIDLITKYGIPLEVAYTDIIRHRIRSLKNTFDKAIKKYKYPGKFLYAYASKANYYSEVISTAINEIDYLETTSSYDLDIVETLLKRKILNKQAAIICNGFKYGRYFRKIIELKRKGLNIVPILENEEEVELFIKKNKLNFNIGLRLTIDETLAQSSESSKRLGSRIDSRFGLSFNEMKVSAEKIRKSKNLKLKVFHMHIGGTIKNINNFIKFVSKVFEKYCELKKIIPDLEFFDIGGGLPTQYNINFSFNYEEFAEKLINNILILSKKNSINPPNIIGEYGRYTVNDHTFFCFEVILKKKVEGKNTFWYLVNGSLMNCLPDSWALGQDFLILPINGWNRSCCKVRLGGITCDPDDTYYKNSRDNIVYLPEFSKEDKLYIGFFGTGAYQEMISGVGGAHHCLLPEGNELIIYKKKNKLYFDKITKLQSAEKVLKILDYHRHHKLERYIS